MPAGSLALYRRHSRTCPHYSKGRRWTRCNCPVWAQGSLGGKWIKDSLNTRDWSVAAATVHDWEAAREIGAAKTEVPTIREALQKYFDDAEARNLAKSTIRKVTERHYSPWVRARQEQLEADVRLTWAPTGKRKKKAVSISDAKRSRPKSASGPPSAH